MDVKRIKELLSNLAEDAVKELRDIIQSPNTGSATKLKAISMLFDRVGPHSVKASISQSLSVTKRELPPLEDMSALLIEEEAADREIVKLQAQLNVEGGKNGEA